MKTRLSENPVFAKRAILVLGVLLCLCVSDSAGPRLFPLPASAGVNVEAEAFSAASCLGVSQTQNQNREPHAYLQMVAASQYRARDCHSQGQLATHAPHRFCQSQSTALITTAETYAPFNIKTEFLSVPTGRAPPHLGL